MEETVKTAFLMWDYGNHQAAIQRERELRWSVPNYARVVHPKYGCVVVPHHSNFSAVRNAAEYWNCDWLEIINAEVWQAGPGDGPAVAMPERFRERQEAI